MEKHPISQDDLIDVMEMTDKLEDCISAVFNGNQSSLALSALMSASINCMMSQCKTLEEVMLYRNVFVKMIDESIRGIEIRIKNKSN